MARLARVVYPGLPYHVTHRGNRRCRVFVADDDRDGYVALLATYARKHGVDVHAWCLMSNHVHLVVRGREQRSVSLALGNAHGKYAQWLNGRHGLSGHVWANRYYSTPLDLPHLIAAVRYVELNPVRAGLVSRAEDWPWSSARAHVLGCADPLLTGENPLTEHVSDWSAWLHAGLDDPLADAVRRNTMTGRPCGGSDFLTELERRLNRILRPMKTGRKAKAESAATAGGDLFGGGERD